MKLKFQMKLKRGKFRANEIREWNCNECGKMKMKFGVGFGPLV